VTRPLDPLFDPASLAIVGASADPAKWGNLLARGALAGQHRRTVYLVNLRGGEILGQRVFRELRELPSPPELVVVTVPPAHFEEAVDDALEAGARAIVGITAGLGEAGGEAQAREAALAERVRAAGAALLGPNCLGVFDRAAELDLAPWVDFPPGELGLIAQSGNLAVELGLLAGREGLGVARFASLGNQADLEPTDLLANLAAHDATRLIALYVEDFGDGRAFARAAQAAVAAGKPVVLLAGGASEASARAARSHTGALVSDVAAVDAACRAAGIVRVSTPQELVDVAKALLVGRRPRGPRVAVFGDGGGHGVVAADLAGAFGLEVPVLSDALRSELASVLRATATTTNPIDFAGGEEDLARFEQVARILLDSDEVDALLLTGYFGGYGGEVAELSAREVDVAVALARAAAALERPLVVHTIYPESAAASALRAEGVLVYREIERAVQALGVLAAQAVGAVRRIPDLPEPQPAGAPDGGYLAARALVAAAGIPLPETRPVRTLDEARSAAAALGYPLVLKTLAREHKSDSDGVVLGIDGPDTLARAFGSLERRLGPECAIERMEAAGQGLELIVGVRRDPRFGPLLLVGLGGLYAEVFRDVAVALAPVEPEEAEELLRSLRCAPILAGARGRPALDVPAAARAASDLSRLASAAPDVLELEVNPLLVRPAGVVALDARVISTKEPES
jgi:acyl-CoA synthetase (NDP forming)